MGVIGKEHGKGFRRQVEPGGRVVLEKTDILGGAEAAGLGLAPGQRLPADAVGAAEAKLDVDVAPVYFQQGVLPFPARAGGEGDEKTVAVDLVTAIGQLGKVGVAQPV